MRGGLMQAVLRFFESDFAKILDGERDRDLHRQLACAIRQRLSSCVREKLDSEWLKQVTTGREEFGTEAGPIGSPSFSLLQMHRECGFFGWDFRLDLSRKSSGHLSHSGRPSLEAERAFPVEG